MYSKGTTLNANITIRSTYGDSIRIKIQDITSGITFVDVELTRESFINATMNQLACSPVKEATVYHLDKVGKNMEMKPFKFELPAGTDSIHEKEVAESMIDKVCPNGWVPDRGFNTQTSFEHKNNKIYARTSIRRWV